jgi:hypothetical protein
MGDRLKTYRQKNDAFDPSAFKFELLNLDTMMPVDGFKAETDFEKFTYFVIARDLVLSPGRYMLCVFPIWNKSAHLFEGGKDTSVRILCQTDLQTTELEHEEGKKLWMQAKLSTQYDDWLDWHWNNKGNQDPMNQ